MSQTPGKAPSDEEVQQIIHEVDLDGDGTINFNGTSLLVIADFLEPLLIGTKLVWTERVLTSHGV